MTNTKGRVNKTLMWEVEAGEMAQSVKCLLHNMGAWVHDNMYVILTLGGRARGICGTCCPAKVVSSKVNDSPDLKKRYTVIDKGIWHWHLDYTMHTFMSICTHTNKCTHIHHTYTLIQKTLYTYINYIYSCMPASKLFSCNSFDFCVCICMVDEYNVHVYVCILMCECVGGCHTIRVEVKGQSQVLDLRVSHCSHCVQHTGWPMRSQKSSWLLPTSHLSFTSHFLGLKTHIIACGITWALGDLILMLACQALHPRPHPPRK